MPLAVPPLRDSRFGREADAQAAALLRRIGQAVTIEVTGADGMPARPGGAETGGVGNASDFIRNSSLAVPGYHQASGLIQQVDVFTAVPFKGNLVAVVLDADDLSSEKMQSIAA
jgi:hypothetical protein